MNSLTKVPFLQFLVALVCFFVISFYAGYTYRGHEFMGYLRSFQPLRKEKVSFALINPLVGIDSPNAFDVGIHRDVKRQLEDSIRDFKGDGLLDAAVYYRNLNSSIWFGINEDEEFIPASLLKMVFALAAYKQEEDKPGFLAKKVTYSEKIHNELRLRTNGTNDTTLIVGNYYSVQELIDIMLTKSDNGARDLLLATVDEQYVNEVYEYLGIAEPKAVNNFQISTADYALFFRMLYSSTFINEKHSEELLETLTKTDFTFGINQTIPSKIAIAHKWGVYNSDDNIQELHDCGIIYKPGEPYILCVMTKATNQDVLAKFIAQVSSVIYAMQDEN